MFTMDDLFEIAIKMEHNGETIYYDSADKLSNPALREVLEWMASEEASHAQWFSFQKNKLNIEIDEARLKEMVPDALKEMMGQKTLTLEEIDFAAMETVDDLFNTFIGFEEDTIVFYELLEMFIDDPTVVKGLDAIIEEEKKHIQTLKEKMAFFSGETIQS